MLSNAGPSLLFIHVCLTVVTPAKQAALERAAAETCEAQTSATAESAAAAALKAAALAATQRAASCGLLSQTERRLYEAKRIADQLNKWPQAAKTPASTPFIELARGNHSQAWKSIEYTLLIGHGTA
ncbi:hypothetical protein AB1Y20_021136 [Prymnesium parvum]|uniref:Uncharacterized protein n=1 Tax=Prymnesium parvum TaxID=97485 RepID=A0AB34JHW4_PRYPA